MYRDRRDGPSIAGPQAMLCLIHVKDRVENGYGLSRGQLFGPGPVDHCEAIANWGLEE